MGALLLRHLRCPRRSHPCKSMEEDRKTRRAAASPEGAAAAAAPVRVEFG